jgi:hypothetical protein
MAGLHDIRGYDGVDPAWFVELLLTLADQRSFTPPYGAVMDLGPKIIGEGKPILLPGMDMLGVRYIIFPGSPPQGIQPDFQADGYWASINPKAFGRVFIPRTTELVTNASVRLEKLSSANFDPAEVAYLEEAADLPAVCSGTARLEEEISTKVVISAHMETPGLLVLTDLWYPGWNAYEAGKPAHILRVNHALRGVALPSGEHRVEFRYEPASFRLGVELAIVAAVAIAAWLVRAWRATGV